MWLEIISTAVVTSVATHLAPHAYSFLKGKFVRVKPVEVPSGPPPLGRVVDFDRETKVFKIKAAPARQHTLLGNNNNLPPRGGEYKEIALKIKEPSGEEIEEEISEAAKDREISEEDMAAFTKRTVPYSELEVGFEFAAEGPAYDPKVGVIPPNYNQDGDGKPTPELRAEYDQIAADQGLKTRA